MIKYSEFVQVKSRKSLDKIKANVKEAFELFDRLKTKPLDESDSGIDLQKEYKKDLLEKSEVKRILESVFISNNNQNDTFLIDHDSD